MLRGLLGTETGLGKHSRLYLHPLEAATVQTSMGSSVFRLLATGPDDFAWGRYYGMLVGCGEAASLRPSGKVPVVDVVIAHPDSPSLFKVN